MQGGGGVTFFTRIQKGDVPRVEGGKVFLRDPKGGVKKNPVNQNENLQTSPPHTSLNAGPMHHFNRNNGNILNPSR